MFSYLAFTQLSFAIGSMIQGSHDLAIHAALRHFHFKGTRAPEDAIILTITASSQGVLCTADDHFERRELNKDFYSGSRQRISIERGFSENPPAFVPAHATHDSYSH